MFYISSRVRYPERHRSAAIAFGQGMVAVLERQPGLIRIEFFETGDHTATEMRSGWESKSDFERWESSDDYTSLFSTPGAFDFADCEFSSETFEAL